MAKAICKKCNITGYITEEDYEKILNNRINLKRKEIGLTRIPWKISSQDVEK